MDPEYRPPRDIGSGTVVRLTTAGTPGGPKQKPVVGIISREPLPKEARGDRILVVEELPDSARELVGYSGFITTAGLERHAEPIPTISSVRDVDHLRTNDIVAMEPRNGFIRTLYRPDSDYNVIFATERCNSNCLMCSQPPQDRDDIDALTERNLQLIRLIGVSPARLVITGGEPTLLGERLFAIITALRDKFPETYLHMLTNGRVFAWPGYTARLAALAHPNFVLGIPLYSDDSTVHDYVVQAKGAFDQTVIGLHQLARHGLRIELRVVLHAVTIPRLPELAEYIYRNLTFVEHIALMGLENIGYAPRNMDKLWIDPHDYTERLGSAVEILSTRMMNVSIYNHQLCVLPRSLWKFARKSISDWKNIYLEECQACGVREQCGGFFQWATKLHSSHIRPLSPGWDKSQPDDGNTAAVVAGSSPTNPIE
ncbi:MAG: His-Xaa-Ser system radical SAM maturase HxsC [Terriglobales bacterium]